MVRVRKQHIFRKRIRTPPVELRRGYDDWIRRELRRGFRFDVIDRGYGLLENPHEDESLTIQDGMFRQFGISARVIYVGKRKARFWSIP